MTDATNKTTTPPDNYTPARHPLLNDPAKFFRTCLAHHCRNAFNPMHTFSFQQYQRQHAETLPARTGRRLAIAAPRGAAKSTIHTMLFPILDILSGRERHQVIISGTMAQAKNRIATIARELRFNPVIRDTFFGGRQPRFKSTTRSIELGNCRIEAFSAGSEMRGVSHGEYRPTRIILDDVEQTRNADRPWQRKKLLQWYDEVVENLGDSYTHITIVGTVLHIDGLLPTLLHRPGYKGQLYKSIIEWDNAPELWRRWQRLFTDPSDEDAVDTAHAFFQANKDAMLAGVKVFWPEKEPYIFLQQKLLVLGRAAFFKEKQNSPIRSGDQLFDTSLWTRFISPDGYIQVVPRALTIEQEEELASMLAPEDDPARRHHRSDLKYYGFLDPALGKSTTRDGDYAAIVTVGVAPDKTMYVMDVWMDRVSPMHQVKQVFALHQKYNYQVFGFESNGFQDALGNLIRHEQTRLKTEGSPWRLPIKKFNNHHSKHSRIAQLEPHILAGSIMFQKDLREEFYSQADEYNARPTTHDDGLDALASCIELIQTQQTPKAIKTIKRGRLY